MNVLNVAPVVAIDSVLDQTGVEIGVDVEVGLVGFAVSVAGSFTDAGLDKHTAVIDWGDSSTDDLGPVMETAVGSHSYRLPGTYVIAFTPYTVIDSEFPVSGRCGSSG